MSKPKGRDRTERTVPITYPVTTFTLARTHIAWIEKKAAQIGRNKRSEFMRQLIDKAMKEDAA